MQTWLIGGGSSLVFDCTADFNLARGHQGSPGLASGIERWQHDSVSFPTDGESSVLHHWSHWKGYTLGIVVDHEYVKARRMMHMYE